MVSVREQHEGEERDEEARQHVAPGGRARCREGRRGGDRCGARAPRTRPVCQGWFTMFSLSYSRCRGQRGVVPHARGTVAQPSSPAGVDRAVAGSLRGESRQFREDRGRRPAGSEHEQHRRTAIANIAVVDDQAMVAAGLPARCASFQILAV